MASYMTRVELHKADNRTVTADDYETLHAQMRAKGFKTTITSSEPKVYKLLTAEYDRSTTADIATVLADAKAAASEVVRTSPNVKAYSVFVSEYTKATWYNLEEVKVAAAR
jgi:6-phosphogluconolactonase/glucosamine-6-phosphate isomerase/deaminase